MKTTFKTRLKTTFGGILIGSFSALTLALTLAGCGGQKSPDSNSASTPADSTTLTIISPNGREIQTEFERAFKAKNPNVNLKWQDQGGSSEALRFILAQFQTKTNKDDGIGADIFFGGGLESYMELEEAGVLQPMPANAAIPAALNGVPLKSAKNEWVASALSGFGILYNKSIASRDKLPIPQTWGDLGKKELFGRIELADPRKSGSAHVAYEIILQTNGWENGWKILAATAGNARTFIESSSTLVNDVSSGEAVFVPAIDFYGRAKIAQAGADKLGYVSPKGQSVITPDPIAILRGAKNKKLAEKFIAFVLSPEGQKLWMLEKGSAGGPTQESLYRMAVLPSLYKPMPKGSLIEIDPFSLKNERTYDFKKAAARRKILDDLIGAVLIDPHNQLKARQGKSGDVNTLMLAPTEAEITSLAGKWSDPVLRQKTLGEWRAAAEAKIG